MSRGLPRYIASRPLTPWNFDAAPSEPVRRRPRDLLGCPFCGAAMIALSPWSRVVYCARTLSPKSWGWLA